MPASPTIRRLYLFALCIYFLGNGTASIAATLTSVAAVKSLSPDQASNEIPVQVKGTIILAHDFGFVLHDGTNGIFVYHDSEEELRYGDLIELDAITDPGDFAPALRSSKITLLGTNEITPIEVTQGSDLEDGTFDCQWISVEGWLRNAQPATPSVPHISGYATLASGPHRFRIEFTQTPFETIQAWVGSRVKLQAACLHFFNSHGQVYGVRLNVPNSKQVEVLEAAIPAESLPLSEVQSLLRYSLRKQDPSRVRIQGVVTYNNSQGESYVQDKGRGIFVSRLNAHDFSIGDTVDVVGFTRQGIYSPEIEDAIMENTSLTISAAPEEVDFDTARISDGKLIRIRATLLDVNRVNDLASLTLKSGESSFTAKLEEIDNASLPAMGSELQLTGVVRVNQAPNYRTPFPWRPESFELLLRSPEDVILLGRPPINRALWIFGGASVLSTLALAVAGTLWLRSRRRVREQERRRIVREAEFAAMIKERMRLAREIHDSLAQGFTAVSIQLENAKHLLSPNNQEAVPHLDQARQLVRDSLAEARRSIQGLRHEALSNADFLAALKRASARILAPAHIDCRFELHGDVARLGAETENELIAIASEAMTNIAKHSGASNASVRCEIADRHGSLLVQDNGKGLPPDFDSKNGYGIRGMRERASRCGGEIEIRNSSPDGTTVRVNIPLY